MLTALMPQDKQLKIACEGLGAFDKNTDGGGMLMNLRRLIIVAGGGRVTITSQELSLNLDEWCLSLFSVYFIRKN